MAYQTGTATNYAYFWTKLLTFLQSDPTLVASGQAWTTQWSAPVGAPNSTDVVLRGPGMSGTDQIYVGLRLDADVPGDRFSISLSGMTGILPGATTYNAHVNSQPKATRMFLANAPMTYWFIANGRRFIAIAKVSTVYEACYAGLALPFSTPSRFPYPLFVGATSGEGNAAVDWRGVGSDHTMFHMPRNTSTIESNAFFLSPEGDWLRCRDNGSTQGEVSMGPDYFGTSDFGIGPAFGNYNYGYNDIKNRISPAYGGAYPITPITMHRSSPSNQAYGQLHGVYHVSGRSNSAENIVTVGGKNHLVVQNVARTSLGEYLAIELEA